MAEADAAFGVNRDTSLADPPNLLIAAGVGLGLVARGRHRWGEVNFLKRLACLTDEGLLLVLEIFLLIAIALAVAGLRAVDQMHLRSAAIRREVGARAWHLALLCAFGHLI